ncbi:MAG: hypothetical protein Q8J64_05515, partial [Thermodesulfovibrionales bacterium]|nr:hypothetical protein [Thermodesulfovibrionales bacterium]
PCGILAFAGSMRKCYIIFMNMRHGAFLRLLTVVFLSLLAVSCTDGLPAEFPAPDFTLKDLFTGGNMELQSFRGRPVVLYFFASW